MRREEVSEWISPFCSTLSLRSTLRQVLLPRPAHSNPNASLTHHRHTRPQGDSLLGSLEPAASSLAVLEPAASSLAVLEPAASSLTRPESNTRKDSWSLAYTYTPPHLRCPLRHPAPLPCSIESPTSQSFHPCTKPYSPPYLQTHLPQSLPRSKSPTLLLTAMMPPAHTGEAASGQGQGQMQPPPLKPGPTIPALSLLPEGFQRSDVSQSANGKNGEMELTSESEGRGGKKRMRLRVRGLKGPKSLGLHQLSLRDMWRALVQYLSDPVNAAVAVWAVLAVPACVLVALEDARLLQLLVTDPETREVWNEAAHQLMNALFVLASAVLMPLLTRHTYFLIRWRTPQQKAELRAAYCKNGRRKPHDRTHISIVVFWGQLACWTTLGYAIVYWVSPAGHRPAALLWVFGVLSWVTPIFAFMHLLFSPLSKDFDVVREGDDAMVQMYHRTPAFFQGHPPQYVPQPQWYGTVCPDCCSGEGGPRIACLTLALPCCMFGYNMERLGFGNKMVQTLAFLVVFLGPLLVFELSAVALGEWGMSQRAMYYCGVVLALCGLAYGGLWRIRIRETFGLPGSRLCCGSMRLTDVCTWMWCGYCALCQEIRTADFYQVEDVEAVRRHATGVPAAAGISVPHDGEGEGDEEGWEEEEHVEVRRDTQQHGPTASSGNKAKASMGSSKVVPITMEPEQSQRMQP